MSKKYVDVDEMKERIHCDDPEMRDYKTLMTFIDRLPEADVAPIIHAYWTDGSPSKKLVKNFKDGYPENSCYCSNCGEWLVASDEYDVIGKYCPNCGAKMDGEEKNKDDN